MNNMRSGYVPPDEWVRLDLCCPEAVLQNVGPETLYVWIGDDPVEEGIIADQGAFAVTFNKDIKLVNCRPVWLWSFRGCGIVVLEGVMDMRCCCCGGGSSGSGEGSTVTVDVVSTTTTEPGSSAKVENVGTSQNVRLSFFIPRGEPGPAGADGADGEDGAPGATGPQGPEGPQGPRGEKGEKGDKGDTGPAGSSVTFDDLTEDQKEELRGETGPQGPQGPEGPKGEKGDKGDKGDPGDAGMAPEEVTEITNNITKIQNELAKIPDIYMKKAGGAYTGAVVGKTISLAANDVDVALGEAFTKTITGDTTFTFSKGNVDGAAIPSDACICFSILLINGGSATVTWPASVKWPDGAAPELAASGADVLTFMSFDGGTTYYGALAIGGAL